jgi:hypothetical protein
MVHCIKPPQPPGAIMDKFVERQNIFVERQNIAHYINQLSKETAPIKRAMLQRLLTEEMVKQASHPTDIS